MKSTHSDTQSKINQMSYRKRKWGKNICTFIALIVGFQLNSTRLFHKSYNGVFLFSLLYSMVKYLVIVIVFIQHQTSLMNFIVVHVSKDVPFKCVLYQADSVISKWVYSRDQPVEMSSCSYLTFVFFVAFFRHEIDLKKICLVCSYIYTYFLCAHERVNSNERTDEWSKRFVWAQFVRVWFIQGIYGK